MSLGAKSLAPIWRIYKEGLTMKTRYKNGNFYLNHHFLKGDMIVEDGKILEIGTLAQDEEMDEVDLEGQTVVPGFIDIHTHGAVGVDVNGADAQGFEKICQFFASQGTTSWLGSVLTDTREQTLTAIGEYKAWKKSEHNGAQMLGIHLEGPFLGNAMKLLHQHFPAIWGAVLEDDEVYCEMICDGRHLHPGTVRFIMKMKGLDRVVAITDSIMAAGLPDGYYKLGVNDVVVVDGDAKLVVGNSRAGSTLTTGQALKNVLAYTGRSLQEIIPMFTENPAKLIGVYDKIGSLNPGKDADFLILDAENSVKSTYVKGRKVF